jgi:hypothetical protein
MGCSTRLSRCDRASTWMGQTRPSITVTAYITRTDASTFSHIEYRISDEASGAALEEVPFGGGSGDGDPPLNQRSRLVTVLWDTEPRTAHLTVTLHDFYWPDGKDVVLRGVRVPAGSGTNLGPPAHLHELGIAGPSVPWLDQQPWRAWTSMPKTVVSMIKHPTLPLRDWLVPCPGWDSRCRDRASSGLTGSAAPAGSRRSSCRTTDESC